MDLWRDFLTTWVGLLSFGVILFMLGMSVFFFFFFQRKMSEDAAAEKRDND